MVRELAPAKLNLVLHVGPAATAACMPISSLFASLELADELEAQEAGGGGPTASLCPGVEGENLAAAALDARSARRSAARSPRSSCASDKRIPVAAGLGGGSADAAAALRAANRIAGHPLDAAALRGAGPAARLRRAEPGGARPRRRDGHRGEGRADRAARGPSGAGAARARPVRRRGVRRARSTRGLAAPARSAARSATSRAPARSGWPRRAGERPRAGGHRRSVRRSATASGACAMQGRSAPA